MEKEQKKLSTGVVILIITLIVALIIVSALFALELLKEGETKGQLNSGLNNDLREDNLIESSTKIFYVNDKKHEVEVDIFKGEPLFPDEEINDYFKWKYSVKIDGKEVKNIEETYGGKYSNKDYRISKMIDNNNNEYIMLEVYTVLMAGGTNVDLYIIDEKANVLGTIKHLGNTTYAIDKNGDGEIHNEETAELDTFWDDMIIDYKKSEDGKTFEKHIYTIEDGKIVDKIEEVYKEGEFKGIAGQID